MTKEKALSAEEADLVARSVKKVKGGEQSFSKEYSLPVSYADLYEEDKEEGAGMCKRSYRDSVVGAEGGEEQCHDGGGRGEEWLDADIDEPNKEKAKERMRKMMTQAFQSLKGL